MANWDIDGKTQQIDRRAHIGAGTLGGDHIVPSSLGGTHVNKIITPFDPRVVFGGPSGTSWNITAGANITNFLSYSASTTSAGCTITVRFIGTQISVMGPNLSAGGRFDVALDGVAKNGAVNTFTPLGASYYSQSGHVLNETDTTVTVQSTNSFASTGTILIDKEEITYTSLGVDGSGNSAFLGCIRGANGTQAARHVGGVTVYQANTMVECYSAYNQSRITLWQIGGLTPGEHTLVITVRSDKNASSSGTTCTINGFIVGGILGSSNINTNLRYITTGSLATDGNGVVNSITLTPPDTTHQLVGILGAYPVSGCNWVFPMWNPNGNLLALKTDTISGTVNVVLTCVFLGPTF